MRVKNENNHLQQPIKIGEWIDWKIMMEEKTKES